MGMDLNNVIRCSTENAAAALRRPDLGTLEPGAVGDATLLSVDEGSYDYVDVVGEHMTGNRKINARGTVIAGELWHDADATTA